VTRFRGFNQFGLVGSIGMILCWMLTFSLLPALIVVLERHWPSAAPTKQRERHSAAGRLFLGFIKWLMARPRVFLAGTSILGLLALIPVYQIASDPFEYNFLKLRNKRSLLEGPASHQREILEIFGRPLTPGVLLADSSEEVSEAREKIIAKDDAGPRICTGEMEALSDFLPAQQEQKMVVLSSLRKILDDDALALSNPKTREQIEALRERLEPLFPGDTPKQITIEDLPEGIAASYTELDGTRGRLLQVQRGKGISGWDGRDLTCFANATSEIKLSTGNVVSTTGVAEVVNDMINAIIRDGPRATIASLLAVILLLFFTFREPRAFGVVVLSLLLGVSLMLGVAALFGMRLNFFNFVAIPITFGIASEYSVNLYERARHSTSEHLADAIYQTGGAISLCSLTTMIGYSTLLLSDNQALNSFGLLAGLGEPATLITAVIVVTTLRSRPTW
jgi:predicted RND superfamily exporter protein